ncbi:MAG: rubrerythrin family protein [Chloroflexi bacterium]|nr:rubrerythrin family protein [Chloroflexota bacterium]
MTKTIDNLKAAFAGESQANRKYLAFAKKADEEGHKQVARLFRAAAHAETVHALNHFKAAGEIKSTAENLQAAIAGENYEVVSMYPPMLAEAETSGEKAASRSFRWALEVEKIHEALYRKAAELLGKPMPETDYYVCPMCGFTHEGPFEDKCPVCGAPGEKFERVA